MSPPLPYEHVNREEPIVRFLVQPKWFNPRTKHVAAQAFKPRNPKPPSTTFRTSVYRVEGCTSDEIWAIGEKYVTSNRTDGLRVLGRADIQAAIILDQGLLVDPTPIPHPRHADIVNWSDKPEQRLDEMGALALQAELVLPPPSTVKP
jgi:hypothetical protein